MSQDSWREKEWLEADGLGGFASGTAAGVRTRRYHALLLSATRPPTGRQVLVNGCDAVVETDAGRFALSAQLYAPGVVHPDGEALLAEFTAQPWPTWTWELPGGLRVRQEIIVPRGKPATVVRWSLGGVSARATLEVRPFLSGRDYHGLQRENPALSFAASQDGEQVRWQTYGDVPPVCSIANAQYTSEPLWYRQFLYAEEQARGLDCLEDLASPGTLRFLLGSGPAVWILTSDGTLAESLSSRGAVTAATELADAEARRRAGFPSALDRAAEAYLVRRGSGHTVVAGYPWFTDWGRDTFIALRGLCLATGRLAEAREILLEWAGAVSLGMLPNRFPDSGEAPEYNSVDASLWFVIAVHELRAACRARGEPLPAAADARLRAAVLAILEGYATGTRYGIRADVDGLLAAGAPGVQLTWMDAKVGDWVVTPRIGKPVEVQALWLNAVRIGAELDPRWAAWWKRGQAAFARRFWNERAGSLHDVVEVDHVPGAVDATFRPNQIFAVGGLPFPLLEGERARRVVLAVEARLYTPLGLRTLPPEDPDYAPTYQGGVRERDGAYHRGTVWPWLIGAFVEAWVRVHGGDSEARRMARARFLRPLLDHLDAAGIGHVSEIADADPPHHPRGCPFQAWSLGEVLRLTHAVLGQQANPPSQGESDDDRRSSAA